MRVIKAEIKWTREQFQLFSFPHRCSLDFIAFSILHSYFDCSVLLFYMFARWKARFLMHLTDEDIGVRFNMQIYSEIQWTETERTKSKMIWKSDKMNSIIRRLHFFLLIILISFFPHLMFVQKMFVECSKIQHDFVHKAYLKSYLSASLQVENLFFPQPIRNFHFAISIYYEYRIPNTEYHSKLLHGKYESINVFAFSSCVCSMS